MADIPCLQDTAWPRDWELWLRQQAPGLSLDLRGPVFSLYSLALEETKNGAGVLMGHEPLVRGFLDRGELVAPFEDRVMLAQYLVLCVASAAANNTVLCGAINLLSATEE